MGKNTMILAEGVEYSLDCYETQLNNNVLVVGAAGTGKTRTIVKPNLYNATGSYIITDPKGNLYEELKDYLRRQGYRVLKLDFTHPNQSAHYNPFSYIRNTQDILKMGHMLMYEPHPGNADPFWEHSSEILLQAMIGYLWEMWKGKDNTLESVIKLINEFHVDEYSPDDESVLDRVMKDAEKQDKNAFCVKQYKKFRCAAGKTLKSIMISVFAKIAYFDVPEVLELTKTDDLDIGSIGMRKTALFVVVSDTDRSIDPLVNLFFTQAMNELCFTADNYCKDNKLPVPVRFILDDFATNCCIDDFPRMIASVRSRNISTMLMIQAESQLKDYYGYNDKTIIGNCDTYVYLGGNDIDTALQVAKRLDAPMTDILRMPVGRNWIFRRGQEPIYGQNTDIDKIMGAIYRGGRGFIKVAPVA